MAKTRFLFTFFVAIASIFSLGAEPRNLVNWKQNFVLETRQIQIPGFPEAFNPSIVRWQGKLLMSFRTNDPLTLSTDGIGLVWLDNNFNPISTPTLLERIGETSAVPSKAQDPRLVVVSDELFIIYSNLYPFSTPVSRMYVGKVVEASDGSFSVVNPSALINYSEEIRTRKEKNWVPFVYNHTLLLAYSLQPHLLMLPLLEENNCLTIASTAGNLDWKWGKISGGTPAQIVDGRYLGFFHANAALSSVQSGGVIMNHYFMGAYTFDAEPPFAMNGISPHPIVARTFYEGPMYKTWKPLRVVFPGGFIFDDQYVWVAYGRQDHEIWIVKLDKAELISSLKPVTTVLPAKP